MNAKTYGVLLLIILVAIGLWNLIHLVTHRSSGTTTSVASFAGVQPNETLLVQDKVYYPAVVAGGKAVMSLTNKGTLFTRTEIATGATQTVFPDPIDYVPDTVSFSPAGDRAIMHRAERSAENAGPAQTTLYQFAAGTKQALNPAIAAVDWLPDGKQILYLFTTKPQHYQLVKAQPDATHFQVVVDDIQLVNPTLNISPDGKHALITRVYHGESKDQLLDFPLLLIDIETGKMTNLPPKGFISPTWSPDNKLIAALAIHADGLGHVTIYDPGALKETTTNYASLPGKFSWRTATSLLVAAPNPPSPDELITGVTVAPNDQLWSIDDHGTGTPITTIRATPPLDWLTVINQGKLLVFKRFEFLVKAPLP